MELITPSFGLIIWTLICFTCFILTIVAVIKLVYNTQLEVLKKLFWAFIIVFVPAIGPVLYFVAVKKNRANQTRT